MINLSKFKAICIMLLCVFVYFSCATTEEKVERHMKRARGYLKENRLKDAELELKNVIQLDPDNDMAFYELGEVYSGMNHDLDATHAYNHAISVNPDNIKARLKMGQIYLLAKKNIKARSSVNHILRIAPENVDALMLLGGIQIRENHFETAIKTLVKAITIDAEKPRAHLFLAHLYHYKKDYKKAEIAYLKAIELDPTMDVPFEELMQLYSSKKNWGKAEELLSKMVDDQRHDSIKFTKLAKFYESQGNMELSEKTHKKAVEKAPANIETAIFEQGMFYLRRGKFGMASMALQKARQINKENLDVVIGQAKVLLAENRTFASEQKVDFVLEKDPEHPEANFLKGRFFMVRKQYETALSHFDETIKKDASHYMAKYMKALCLINESVDHLPVQDLIRTAKGFDSIEQWKITMAVEELNNTLLLEPEFTDARLFLAQLLMELGKLEESQRHVATILKSNPVNMHALTIFSKLKILNGDMKGAEAVSKQILMLSGNSAQNYVRLGTLAQAMGNLDKARKLYEKALGVNPKQVDAIEYLADFYVGEGKKDKALELCARFGEKNKRYPKIKALITSIEGKIYLNYGDLQKAKALMKKSISESPQLSSPHEILGKIFETEGNFKKAAQQYEIVHRKNPEFLPVCMDLSRVYSRIGNRDKAEHFLRLTLKLNREHVQASNNLAYLLAEKGSGLSESLKLARFAKEKQPENPDYLDTLGWVYYKHGNYLLSEEELKSSLRINPDNPITNYHMGWACYGLNKFDKARFYMKKALSLDPDFIGADDARGIMGQ